MVRVRPLGLRPPAVCQIQRLRQHALLLQEAADAVYHYRRENAYGADEKGPRSIGAERHVYLTGDERLHPDGSLRQVGQEIARCRDQR